MKEVNTSYVSGSGLTVGLDVGDQYRHFCVLDESACILEEGRVATTESGITRKLRTLAPSLIVIEVGTHSRWLSRLIEELGHVCLIANAFEARRLASVANPTSWIPPLARFSLRPTATEATEPPATLRRRSRPRPQQARTGGRSQHAHR
jgi:hypothetical protein